ncbi:MAG: ATP-binding protein [Boseongicola sp.]|nr:ATP-binding protein [Boseongicola sp.]
MIKRVQASKRIAGNLLIYLAVVLLSAAAIWILSADARREVDALAVANADSTQWSLAQNEVEFLAFTNAAHAVVAGQAEPREARRRFDVLFSRVQTLKSAPAYAEIRERDSVAKSISKIEDFLEKAIPIIDADDGETISGLPDLVGEFSELRKEFRDISLVGVTVFAQRSETQRASVSNALKDLGVISFALLAMLLAVVGVLIMINQASQRQSAEIALTQGRLQAIISTSLDAILVADTDGRVLDFNGAAEGIFGYSRDEAVGADMAEIIIPDHLRDAHNAGMERYRNTAEKRVVGSGLLKLEAKRKDGTVFPVELSINSAQSESGEIFVSYIRDISQRVESENELVEARDQALAGEKAKADLLAVMSHEMRTPLNGVLGTLELLSNTDLNEKQQKYIGVMDASGKMLLDHVNNVLDISRVDAGMADLSEQAFDVFELSEATIEGLRTPASQRGNALSIQVVGSKIGRVLGDKNRLQQILVNLLGNAIKFTENGSISLELEAAPDEGMVDFRVIDTGIGIAEEDLERIFDDFVTLDASYQREVEGTGLGLGIVKRLVQLMGGEIGVESDQGEGSVFWFRVPLKKVTSRPITQPVAHSQRKRTEASLDVLIVEDNEINRMVAREMLEQAGCSVTEATDGQDGVHEAESQKYDLILMDISMPKLDGIAASNMIRGGTGPNKETPIIALTAHALPDDVARFREAGMSDVITKPLSSERLRAVLAELSSENPDTKTAKSSNYGEVIETMGAEKAEALFQRAIQQIGVGLAEIGEMAGKDEHRDEIRATAHKLSGSAALFGMDDVWQGLKELEHQAADMSEAQVRSHVDTLQDALTKLGGTSA